MAARKDLLRQEVLTAPAPAETLCVMRRAPGWRLLLAGSLLGPAIGCGRNAVGAGADAGTAGAGGSGSTHDGIAGARGTAGGGGADAGGTRGTTDGGPCGVLAAYAPTTTKALSFANDIYPLLTDMGSVPPTTPGCASASICHGYAPIRENASGPARTLSFTDPPATVLTTLMKTSVNAPTMALVVPGDVGQSFLAYKISGSDGLSCVRAACVDGASVGTSHPCGDPMPTATSGTLTVAQRTAILDWIAQGAAN